MSERSLKTAVFYNVVYHNLFLAQLERYLAGQCKVFCEVFTLSYFAAHFNNVVVAFPFFVYSYIVCGDVAYLAVYPQLFAFVFTCAAYV